MLCVSLVQAHMKTVGQKLVSSKTLLRTCTAAGAVILVTLVCILLSRPPSLSSLTTAAVFLLHFSARCVLVCACRHLAPYHAKKDRSWSANPVVARLLFLCPLAAIPAVQAYAPVPTPLSPVLTLCGLAMLARLLCGDSFPSFAASCAAVATALHLHYGPALSLPYAAVGCVGVAGWYWACNSDRVVGPVVTLLTACVKPWLLVKLAARFALRVGYALAWCMRRCGALLLPAQGDPALIDDDDDGDGDAAGAEGAGDGAAVVLPAGVVLAAPN